MFNQKKYENLLNEWYKYKDFCCKEHTDEYKRLYMARLKFVNGD